MVGVPALYALKKVENGKKVKAVPKSWSKYTTAVTINLHPIFETSYIQAL